MNDMPMPELVKDPEFTDLIQPRDTQYMEELEEDIFDHGCTDPVMCMEQYHHRRSSPL